MVVSLVLGLMAMFVGTMGMKCTNCGGDDKVKKARIAMTGGIIFIVAGEQQVYGGPRDSLPGPSWGVVRAGVVLDWGGCSQCLTPHFFSRSLCVDSLLLVWPPDCHRLL